MSKKKTTTIAVYLDDADRLWELRKDRTSIPERKPGKGRPPADKETFAEVFKRAVDALEREVSV